MGHIFFEQLYAQTAQGEKETKELLIQFEQDYPGVTKEANVDAIAGNLQKKADKAYILAQLRQKKSNGEQTIQEKSSRKKNGQEVRGGNPEAGKGIK